MLVRVVRLKILLFYSILHIEIEYSLIVEINAGKILSINFDNQRLLEVFIQQTNRL